MLAPFSQREGEVLTLEQRKFLRRIVDYTGAAESHELPDATSQQSAARARCKRDGLAYFDRPYWRITDAGRKALEGE